LNQARQVTVQAANGHENVIQVDHNRFSFASTTTPTPLNHQRRVVKHNKAISLNCNNNKKQTQGGPMTSSNSKIVSTEQFLNQPLTILN